MLLKQLSDMLRHGNARFVLDEHHRDATVLGFGGGTHTLLEIGNDRL